VGQMQFIFRSRPHRGGRLIAFRPPAPARIAKNVRMDADISRLPAFFRLNVPL
jgi:hypothetical protein